MLTVDAHHHLWDLVVTPQAWLDGEALAPIRRDFRVDEYDALATASGIDASVLVQTVNTLDETRELLRVAEASSVVGAVVGWVDLTAPDVTDALVGLAAFPGGSRLRGIRHQVQLEPDPRWLCRDDVRRGLRAVAEAGKVFELVVVPDQLPAAVETARALPSLCLVLDHCGKPPVAHGSIAAWESDVRALAAEPRTSCKLSGLVTEADWARWAVDDLRPAADVVLDAFGADRLMIGSDWPVCLLAGGFDTVLTAYDELVGGCSAGELAAIRGGTATTTYALDR